MRINNNISALNTYRQYNTNTVSASKSMEKLSSGLRINRAADDAAGLSISEKMKSQIRGLDQGTRNAQDGVSLIQTAEGALNEVSSMLVRLKELAVQAANSTYSTDDKANIGSEMNALGAAIGDIYTKTKFNGISVFGTQTVSSASAGMTAAAVEAEVVTALDGGDQYIRYNSTTSTWQTAAAGTWDDGDADKGLTWADSGTQPTIHPAAIADDTVYHVNAGNVSTVDNTGAADTAVTFDAIAATAGGILASNNGAATTATIAYGEDGEQTIAIKDAKTSALNALTTATAAAASAPGGVTVDLVEAAITQVNMTRAGYGAQQNQLDHAANNMSTTKENLQAAESRVRDVDMAAEMMEFTKNNILVKAAQAMLAQANAQPQGVLQLLQ